MSGQVPEAAVEAASAALRDYLDNFPGWKPRGEAEVLLEAALPHIRRAVIEELIAKGEMERDAILRDYEEHDTASTTLARAGQLATYIRLLRAELEGGDRG